MIQGSKWYLFKSNFQILLTIIINLVIAIINPVTTFCISDLRTRNGSRIVEVITVGLLLLNFILILIASQRLLTTIIDFVIVAIQLFLIVYIIILLRSNCGLFISAKAAFAAIGITMFSIAVNIIDYFVTKKKRDMKTITNT